jgi:DNA invertase Pin-like site-specific DNA recombinase
MWSPALKRLMADIEAGKVDCVLVYKVEQQRGRILRQVSLGKGERM